MDINRLKFLSGIKNVTPAKAELSAAVSITGIKLVQEASFKLLAKHFGATEIKLDECGIYTTGRVVFLEQTKELSHEKLTQFKNAWKFYASTDNLQEAYRIAPAIDSDEFPPIKGLEGPFRYESGKVLYYAPKVGKYYDSKTDIYLEPEEVEAHRTSRQVKESKQALLAESRIYGECMDCNTPASVKSISAVDSFVCGECGSEASFNAEHPDDAEAREDMWEHADSAVAEAKKGTADSALKDACWDGYEAIGTKKKNGKTVPNCVPVNEDHGNGFYVMVGDKEHCWCETKAEAEEKAEKLNKDGKKAKVVADKDLHEDKHEGEEDEKGADNEKTSEEKRQESSEKKAEAQCEKEVKEAVSVVDNFVQDDTDKDNELAKRTGVDSMMKTKVVVPAKVKAAVNARITELKKSIEFYDEKGYNDNSLKQKAIECLEQIMDDLAPENVEALKKAQIYFGTLMSPITDLIPSQLVLFLANAEAVKEQEAKDRASVLKRHIAHHTDNMSRLEKDSASYKDHEKALERYKKELAQYDTADGKKIKHTTIAEADWGYIGESGEDYSVAPVEKLKSGEYVKRKPDSKKVYIVRDYDSEFKRFRLDDADDISRDIMVKPGTPLVYGFTY